MVVCVLLFLIVLMKQTNKKVTMLGWNITFIGLCDLLSLGYYFPIGNYFTVLYSDYKPVLATFPLGTKTVLCGSEFTVKIQFRNQACLCYKSKTINTHV